MTMFGRMPGSIVAACSTFARMMRDRRGVAAVEFAFVVPLMLAMYFVTVELAQGIATNKKLGRAASMVADLITQQDKVTGAELDAIMQIGDSIMQPYARSKLAVVARAIEITPEPNSQVKVLWTRTRSGTCAPKAAAVSVPPALKVPNTFLIQVSSELCYKPLIAWGNDQKTVLGLGGILGNINMKETYYLRPRMSTTIPCNSGC